MKISETLLTVYFENPFWVGAIEKTYNGNTRIAKIHFGSSQPKDHQVFDFILKNWSKLRFSKKFSADERPKKKINPKRLQREINKKMKKKGLATKSQLALKKQYEENKKTNKQKTALERRKEKQRKLLLKQEKRKQNRRGN